MKFNDKEIATLSLGDADFEGRLNYLKTSSNSFSSNSGNFKERWFKLKCNLLFYFKLNDLGQIDVKQPAAGVFVLENCRVQSELRSGLQFAFSMTFSDDPERKHLFTARTEDTVHQWVSAIRNATYEHLRSKSIVLQEKINHLTGKDPLLMYPRNHGTIRNLEEDREELSLPKAIISSFQSHVSMGASSLVTEANLIDL
ncbi:pleckstrin homology domain-containing family J member 1-like [Nilaparvata lugens]|uniref:pleckstrin homology domain-containing family J member 1 n=1 Tax=Nilaparvata lugens TaxID=108931 RepID=UPI000B99C5B0|nr:pleckstrin homology domain-containing family J member 1 [Nilaparvata lugens]XP_039277517.1 pleckstrin homology domain-containing family J member 1-like [Nilaparvata lugens]